MIILKSWLKRTLMLCLILPLFSLFVMSCSISRQYSKQTQLKTISIVDRNGMTETISNPDRLKQYQSVNFLSTHPYKKVLRIYSRDKKGNIPSFIHSYHENGQPKQYLEVVNSRAYGTYREWHTNGSLKLQVCVIGGEADLDQGAEDSWLFDGLAKVWDEDGNLIAYISYNKGLFHGNSTYYHSNGCLWRKIPYYENLVHGIYEVYLDDGQPFQKTEYVNGQKHGSSFRYWSSNELASEEEFQQGSLSCGHYYDGKGRVISEVNQGNGYRAIFSKTGLAELHEYRHGFPEGEVKVFGTDAKLLRKFHIKDSQKHGEEVEYYELPPIRHIPKLSIAWYEGKVQGIVKTWYDNGVQESSREMSNNAKTGISTAWYRDGSLMLIEEYDNDKLIKGDYFRRGEKQQISTVKDGQGTVTLFDPEGNFLRKIYYAKGVPTGTN